MDKRKHYGRKIKKSKSLYRRKMSPGKKAFSTVVFVLVVSALVFLGFCVGKPLLDYISNMNKEPVIPWTPAASYSEQQEKSPENSAAPAETDPPAEQTASGNTAGTAAKKTEPPQEEPVSDNALRAYEAPAAALSNRTSLSAVVTKAKAAGYNSVVLQLKDRNGYFNYKTTLENVASTRLVKGSMGLDEIMSVFGEHDMKLVAEIAVLSDHAGCEIINGLNYKCKGTDTSWLDYSTGVPTRWANPEKPATIEYFASIVAELGTAGINDIVLTDVIFPNFQSYDGAYIESKYYAQDRYKMLYNVIKAGNAIEMNAADVLSESYGRTAEVLNNTSMLKENSIALVLNRKALTAENGYPADARSLTEYILTQAKAKAGGVPIIPVIESASFGDADTGAIVEMLGKLGYASFIMRA